MCSKHGLRYGSDFSKPMEDLLELHEELYEAGARSFLFIDVPPIDRSPAGTHWTQ